jgi:hypothetical protein
MNYEHQWAFLRSDPVHGHLQERQWQAACVDEELNPSGCFVEPHGPPEFELATCLKNEPRYGLTLNSGPIVDGMIPIPGNYSKAEAYALWTRLESACGLR